MVINLADLSTQFYRFLSVDDPVSIFARKYYVQNPNSMLSDKLAIFHVCLSISIFRYSTWLHYTHRTHRVIASSITSGITAMVIFIEPEWCSAQKGHYFHSTSLSWRRNNHFFPYSIPATYRHGCSYPLLQNKVPCWRISPYTVLWHPKMYAWNHFWTGTIREVAYFRVSARIWLWSKWRLSMGFTA